MSRLRRAVAVSVIPLSLLPLDVRDDKATGRVPGHGPDDPPLERNGFVHQGRYPGPGRNETVSFVSWVTRPAVPPPDRPDQPRTRLAPSPNPRPISPGPAPDQPRTSPAHHPAHELPRPPSRKNMGR
ncbi:hypothetical protein GCM10027075_43290 [Streptomyces heilongjiangensis]